MHGEKAANHAIAAADLVVAIGSRFGDRQTGNLDKYTENTKFIHIDIDRRKSIRISAIRWVWPVI